MDSATLEALVKLVRDGSPDKRVIRPPAEPPHVYYTIEGDGEFFRREADPAPEDRKAADLETVVRTAIEWDGIGAQDKAYVWHDRTGVRAVSGRDTCTMTLSPSPQLARLMEWDRAGRAHATQAELVILLRTLFDGCSPDHPNLLSAVRALKTSKAADVSSQIQHGKVSLGKSVVAEMSGITAIPEEVTFSVPVFGQPTIPVRHGVRVAIDPDPQQERFTLIVLPGEVERAFAAGDQWVGNRLADLIGPDHADAVTVYHGTPR